MLYNSDTELDFQNRLESIFSNEKAKDILFESYRKTVFSRSKEIGPKIIGVLTAMIINEKRETTDVDENIFDAAEILNDNELIEFSKYIFEQIENSKNPSNNEVEITNGCMNILLGQEEYEIGHEHEITISPKNLSDYLGRWANKMKLLDIFYDEMTENTFSVKADTDRRIDYDMEVKSVKSWLYINEEYFVMAQIIQKIIA